MQHALVCGAMSAAAGGCSSLKILRRRTPGKGFDWSANISACDDCGAVKGIVSPTGALAAVLSRRGSLLILDLKEDGRVTAKASVAEGTEDLCFCGSGEILLAGKKGLFSTSFDGALGPLVPVLEGVGVKLVESVPARKDSLAVCALHNGDIVLVGADDLFLTCHTKIDSPAALCVVREDYMPEERTGITAVIGGVDGSVELHSFYASEGGEMSASRCVARARVGSQPLCLTAFSRVPGAGAVEGLIADASSRIWFASAAEDGGDDSELELVSLR